MNNDITDTKERAKAVAKDILTASELVNHTNFNYTPSKQLKNLMSDEEIATTIMHLKRQGALDIDDRRMYLSGRIQVYPAYEVRTSKFTLNSIVNPLDMYEVPLDALPKQNSNLLSISKPRKDGVMTGKEKMQTVIEEINKKYQGLVTGNVVVLHSGNLGQQGLELHEQKDVLDILSKDNKVIKYSAKNEYESRADIHPRDQVDIYEGSFDQIEADEMFEQALAQQLYTVEVLPTFTAFADKLLGDAELEYQKDVYLLRLLYKRILSILDAIIAEDIAIDDDELDTMYVQLTALIENVLNKPSMQNWQKDAPTLYETLLGHAQEIGKGWQGSDREAVLKFYAKLQKDWTLQGKPDFEPDNKLAEMLEDVYKLIGAYRKIIRRIADDMQTQDIERLTKGLQDMGKREKADDPNTNNDEPADKSNTPLVKKLVIHSPLKPQHYKNGTGVLSLTADDEVEIAGKGKVKRKDGSKYTQCRLMDCLFKSVNAQKSGVLFSTILGVNKAKIDKKAIKKIRNTVAEINKKVSDVGGPKNLIIIQGNKVYVNNSYL